MYIIRTMELERDEMMRIARLFNPKKASNYWDQQDELHMQLQYIAHARKLNHDILRMRKDWLGQEG